MAEAYLRLKTLPGEQAQVDWAHFGTVTIGRAERRLMGFVMVLSYSRRIFLRFYLDAGMSNFQRGHVEAFEMWQGVPRELWYDNLKSVVLERRGAAIRFNPRILDFAGHYRFLPKPVAVARGNEKGRVERAIRYVRTSFFAARRWRDIDDLNAQARAWCDGIAADRRWPEDRSITVREAFERERGSLVALPGDRFPAHDRVEVAIGKTPYARFDLNDYSVPHTHVRRTLVVVATLDEVRILDGADVIATHPRSFDKGACIEIPGHIAELARHKRQARRLRGQDRLVRAAPNSERLLTDAARRGDNLGAIVAALLRLLDEYGAAELETAIGEAIERGVPQAQRTVAEWREVDAAQTALAEEVSALPGRIAAWQAGDLPQDEPGGLDPDHPTRQSRREEGATLEAKAGRMLRPEDAHAPYLDAVPGAREAVRQGAQEVGDALQKDGYRAFGWLTKEVDRQARETRTEAFHVPRYGELVAQAEALSAQAALPARTQEVVASWLGYHARCEPICRQIREWPARLGALTADCPERPATLDALTGWRQRAEPLRAEARAMLAEDGPHASHLAAMVDERKALAEGTGRLDHALIEVEARETDVLSSVVQEWADETGGIGFDASSYAALMERARSLDARPHLPERLRGTVDGLLARDERWARDRDRVEAFLVRAAEAESARNDLARKRNVTMWSFEERLQARQECRQKEKEVLDEAAALRKDVPQHELAAHLGAAGAGPDAVREREEEIRNRIAQEQEKQAALRMSRDRGISM